MASRDASEPPSPQSKAASKVDAERLELRARPRPVRRINRRLIMVLAGTGLLLIFGVTILALDPPRIFGPDEIGRELFRTDNNPTPEGLDALPRSYGDLPAPPIELGPPLPGDLGGAVLETERGLGVSEAPELPFRPSPEDDAARAERIRQARLAQQGREAGVFFQLTSRTAGGMSLSDLPGGQFVGEADMSQALEARLGDPFDALRSAASGDPSGLPLSSNRGLQGSDLNLPNGPADASIYNPHELQDPISPYQVMAGTMIAASLITGINSDLPGRVVAQVTENVHDTVTGTHLLIPQGSRLIGTYDSVIAFGQDRALVVWQRIIMPDGSSIMIDNLPATDTEGYAGLEDEVDYHTWRLLQGVVLSTLLGVSAELTFGDDESDLVRAIRESTQDSVNQVGQRITERNLGIEPTITIRPGWPLRIIVNRDLVLRPYRG